MQTSYGTGIISAAYWTLSWQAMETVTSTLPGLCSGDRGRILKPKWRRKPFCVAIREPLHAIKKLSNTIWPNAMYTFCNSAEMMLNTAITYALG